MTTPIRTSAAAIGLSNERLRQAGTRPGRFFSLLAVALTAFSGCGGGAGPPAAPPIQNTIKQKSVAYQIGVAHSGFATFGKALNFPAKATWSKSFDGQVACPMIANGLVFVLVRKNLSANFATDLIALHEADGSVAWGPVTVGKQSSGLAYDDSRVYVTVAEGTVMAFDAATGKLDWSVPESGLNGGLSAPTAANGLVFVGAYDRIFALQNWNGAEVWNALVVSGLLGQPALSGNSLFTQDGCHIYNFTADLGYYGWSYDGRCSGGIFRELAVAGGKIFTFTGLNPVESIFDAGTGGLSGTYTSNLIVPAIGPASRFYIVATGVEAADLVTNKVLWTFTGGDFSIPPILIDQTVIARSNSGTVYALDAATGERKWSAAVPVPTPDPAYESIGMAAGEGYLLVPSANTLSAWQIAGP